MKHTIAATAKLSLVCTFNNKDLPWVCGVFYTSILQKMATSDSWCLEAWDHGRWGNDSSKGCGLCGWRHNWYQLNTCVRALWKTLHPMNLDTEWIWPTEQPLVERNNPHSNTDSAGTPITGAHYTPRLPEFVVQIDGQTFVPLNS